jgi:hypothetical protein
MAGDTGAKDLRAAVAGIGGERISRRLQQNRIDRLARRRVPAPDDVVSAAGEQRAAVGQERHRPDRQPGPTSVRASVRALRSITATVPPMPAAATSAPSGEIAIEITGLGPAATSPAARAVAVRK